MAVHVLVQPTLFLMHCNVSGASGPAAAPSNDTRMWDEDDRHTWCLVNLPAYNSTYPPPASSAPAGTPGHALAPSAAHLQVGPASAPQTLIAPGPPGHHPHYVCSDAYFFCFARGSMSADDAHVCAHHCCHGACTDDFVYSGTHGWCSKRSGVHACCNICAQHDAGG